MELVVKFEFLDHLTFKNYITMNDIQSKKMLSNKLLKFVNKNVCNPCYINLNLEVSTWQGALVCWHISLFDMNKSTSITSSCVNKFIQSWWRDRGSTHLLADLFVEKYLWYRFINVSLTEGLSDCTSRDNMNIGWHNALT